MPILDQGDAPGVSAALSVDKEILMPGESATVTITPTPDAIPSLAVSGTLKGTVEFDTGASCEISGEVTIQPPAKVPVVESSTLTTDEPGVTVTPTSDPLVYTVTYKPETT
jgi:hypothetical protein